MAYTLKLDIEYFWMRWIKMKTGKVVFDSKSYVVRLFEDFMTVQKLFGQGLKMEKDHPQFDIWYTAFDDIESVSEGNKLCKIFLS